ncbi:MAG: UDP-N-acetylglucosamine--N-acetylmuramyl-(pentapeptide) pyrophosphoryl-undecaprenol N-acetylglucosamine transferase [Roseiflexaceae bacterium]|nr:UDP-N-acetylglucosamine--N-acetylmuramyl-(pentapeptide) pyrophosphoryl-undecaprenol N-acetylglucosamine transferase [Roseiflexus sp.]MDW8213731.1 UDP-N-acetylglucosamine--N-acetylmuramyl-(pentapeptide) pyrophosphoryl-undecaprenol N-acetylglucosamine transferase [Roseiflexaceae bacterium]
MRVWLVGGGTGGHVYPALAVAAALNAPGAPSAVAEATQSPDGVSPFGGRWSALYVGSIGGMEAALVARESALPFQAIPAAALRGRNPLTVIRNLVTVTRGTAATRRLVERDRPAVVLGTGGYVCVPVFLAARMAGIPMMIYLPDVVPGLAVRFLARLSTLIACSVADSGRYLGLEPLDFDTAVARLKTRHQAARLVVTGYPVRQELFHADREACRAAFGLSDELPTLLVAGGSRGSRSINRAIAALLPALLPSMEIIHVCGREGDATFLRAAVRELPESLQKRYHLFEYLHGTSEILAQGAMSPAPTMVAALAAADLAVCRSGASTLGELPAVGLPAVLVPYPHVHQDENADYLVQRGAAIKISDAALAHTTEEGLLFREIYRLMHRREERCAMAERMRALAQLDAARRIAFLLQTLVIRRQTA